MTHANAAHASMVLSYFALRKAIGIVGIMLPFVLALGQMLFDGFGVEPSISAYYHTEMGDVFVGSLCAIAVFMLSYHGYDIKDDVSGDLAFLFAIGAALFPVAPELNPTANEELIGTVHLVFAALFLLTLAYFSLVLFRKTDSAVPMTPRKKYRNRVYTVCGYTMLAGLAMILVVLLLPDESLLLDYKPVFWLESIVIVAFGVSWFTKGEGILKDREL